MGQLEVVTGKLKTLGVAKELSWFGSCSSLKSMTLFDMTLLLSLDTQVWHFGGNTFRAQSSGEKSRGRRRRRRREAKSDEDGKTGG